MDFNGISTTVSINPAELSDKQVAQAAQEFVLEARERGLEIPALSGTVALGETVTVEKIEAEPHEPTREPLTKDVVYEAIANQRNTATDTYYLQTDSINGLRKKRDQIERASQEEIAQEFAIWISDDKLEYVKDAMEADPELEFTLVMAPNAPVTAEEIFNLAREFGKRQPYETYIWDEIYRRYTPEQLSGTRIGNQTAVNFVLVPNKLNPDMYGTVKQQQAALAKAQADAAFVRVPSVLQAVAYWQTLRADPDNLKREAFDKTNVRHFDLPEQRVDRWLYVPYSYVDDGGRPYLRSSNAENDYDGRVAVG